MQRVTAIAATISAIALFIIAGIQVYETSQQMSRQSEARAYAITACEWIREPVLGDGLSPEAANDKVLTQLSEQLGNASRAARLDETLAPLERGLLLLYRLQAMYSGPSTSATTETMTVGEEYNANRHAVEALCDDLGVPAAQPAK